MRFDSDATPIPEVSRRVLAIFALSVGLGTQVVLAADEDGPDTTWTVWAGPWIAWFPGDETLLVLEQPPWRPARPPRRSPDFAACVGSSTPAPPPSGSPWVSGCRRSRRGARTVRRTANRVRSSRGPVQGRGSGPGGRLARRRRRQPRRPGGPGTGPPLGVHLRPPERRTDVARRAARCGTVAPRARLYCAGRPPRFAATLQSASRGRGRWRCRRGACLTPKRDLDLPHDRSPAE